MAKMTNETFRTLLEHEITEAYTWAGSGIRGEQRRNLAYYLGLPLGNEVDGRSQVVSWDVFETVEGALPSFIEPFFSGDNIGEFLPRGPEDEAYASQATEYVNYIIKDRNPGFLIFTTWIKDALLSKVGVVRAKWVQPDPVKQEYQSLTDEQLTQMLQDEGVELIAASSQPMPLPEEMALQLMQAGQPLPQLHDVTIKRKRPGNVELHNVEPGCWIVSKGAKTLDDAPLVGEFVTYTRSQLREMGFSAKDVAEVKSYDASEETVDPDRIDRDDEDSIDKALESVTLFEGFIRADMDGDGIAEWRRVLAGGNLELENEECDGHEYAVLTPIPIPHRVIGMALADPAVELQRLGTGLTRQYVDSLYLANNPRTYVNMAAKVNMEDVISNRIGGVIRGTGNAAEAIQPIKTAFVASESLQGLEMIQGMRERRTGVTRYNQGLDGDTLNKTATGVTKVMNAADKRQLLMLRIFAETGVKQLFRLVLRLITKYQDMADVVRLRNQFVQFDPRGWSPEMDVQIEVGIGTGDKTETLMLLQQFGQFMQQAAAVGLVGPQQVYEFGKALAKNAKLKGADEKFMLSPDKIPPKQQQPDPEMIKAQMAQQQAQQKQQLEQARLQFEAMEGDKQRAHDLQIKQMELDQQQRGRLLELAAGYMMGQSRQQGQMQDPAINIMGGTMLDQNMQAPGVGEQQLNEVAAVINGFADRFGGGNV
jgi:hypothetical protein